VRPRLALVLFGLALILALDAAGLNAGPWSWLGVRIRDLSEHEMEDLAVRHGIREGFGVLVIDVMADTPAAAAGLRNGDVVVAFEDRPVVETRLLQRLIAAGPVEREVRLTILRPEGRRAVPVRLVAMPREVAGERIAAEFGFVLRETEAQPELGARRPAGASPSVSGVLRGSAAERGGLEVGDVLLQVNDQSVLTRDAARLALADVGVDRPLRLTVRRGDAVRAVILTAP
jgi:serine protease Do